MRAPTKLRKQRREEARKAGVPFEPIYNGEGPQSHKEMYGYDPYEDRRSKGRG